MSATKFSVFSLAAGIAVLAAVQPARAQSVTEADIERARKSQPVITDQDIERAQLQNRMPSDADLLKVPVPSTPRIDALPQPKTVITPDLGAIAKGFEAGADGKSQGELGISGPALLVFVSFSMPEATLTRLAEQASRAKATLVLRGFVNGSLKETVSQVQTVLGNRRVAFQIDPQAFDRFVIGKTPSFALVRPGAVPRDCASGQCVAKEGFVTVAGDVSLDYALEHITRAAPGFTQEATVFLDRMRGIK